MGEEAPEKGAAVLTFPIDTPSTFFLSKTFEGIIHEAHHNMNDTREVALGG